MSRLKKSWPSASHPAPGYHMQGSGDGTAMAWADCMHQSSCDSAQETLEKAQASKTKKARDSAQHQRHGKGKKERDQKVKCNPPSQAFPIYALQPLALILGAGHLMHEGAIKSIRQTSPRRRLEYRIQRPSPRLAVASHLARPLTRWLRRARTNKTKRGEGEYRIGKGKGKGKGKEKRE
ncbi:hypothetical protein M431DRAFT_289141 [Trichoderma harzianum CBS 226.95]|uniref:Uncharacterized protein n=1 Tax=Trichoderma harzianum CBS 226.95 TaxID=983964 RepID=A0A2T4AP90_TRIHA|nr:hypothetical protein M431DRAFT_289141 [Trichoderma harzianum CBS 226.95]PTB58881.1 hypothetical protein M431DRAFT_289141 [Trichoderma harzianum CBS 226.95]